MTSFQDSQNSQARQEIKTRFTERVAEFGDTFRDVIFVSANKHGRGKVGFSCEFGGQQTYASGKTLVEFARKVFGAGTLKRIDDERYAVIE